MSDEYDRLRAQYDAQVPEDAVRTLLRHVGEDPTRQGLVETPKRVAKAWREMTQGYAEDPKEILSKVFSEERSDGMVIVRDIPFVSMCEHHCLPFTGVAHVAYIPSPGKVVGLSKLARLVQCFAKRLQVQERLTRQIVEALNEHLMPLGAACIIEATHSCMALRGVKAQATMVTSEVSGAFVEREARAELLSLVRAR
jgi:GTP cyclohydrolase IA